MSRKLGFLAFAILVLLIIFFPVFSKIQELKQENNELQEKIGKITQENASLLEGKRNLETNAFYIEKAAREKLGVAKKGETVYRISPEE